MNPSFSCYLVNEPFGDPGLYIEVRWSRRALLFDLGANEPLSPTRLLRAMDAFVTHLHMDHFIGFDRLLRVSLGRGKTLRLFGPPGLIAAVTGKLRGYTWNLVDGYPLTIEVREFHPQETRLTTFRAAEAFEARPAPATPVAGSDGSVLFPVLQDAMFTVSAAALNHRVPSFGYALQEQFHINVNKEKLKAAGLPVGSWLREAKEHLWQGRPDEFRFTAPLYFAHRREDREFVLGEVRDRFMTITRGQRVVYVVDCRYDQENEAKIVELAREADVFFCEAPYLDRDRGKAYERYHLTARQAGLLARKAGVRDLVVFHFSPRYTGMGKEIVREAIRAFEGS